MIALFRTSWDSPIVRSMMTAFLASNADEVEQRIIGDFLKISGEGPAVAAFFAQLVGVDTGDLAQRIGVPALVIHGQEDRTVALAAGRELASLIPGARFEIIEGADHIQSTSARRTRELIVAFLAPPAPS
jgi:pimeloyl-ACP methyl ester carboxylesterase